MPNSDLYEALVTATGARTQPLIVATTTAGIGRESLCRQLYTYAKEVRDGIIKDDTFYPAIFELDEGDDWEDEGVWHKAQPFFEPVRLLLRAGQPDAVTDRTDSVHYSGDGV